MNSWNVLYKFDACYLFLLCETGPLVAQYLQKDGLGDQNLELGDQMVAQYLC